jgi:trk system potassium uptake protein TrkH
LIDLRPIFFILGFLLMTLAIAMGLPAVVDAVAGNPDWWVFAGSMTVTMFIGVSLVLTNRKEQMRLSLRQTFVLTAFSWVVITIFAALPFAFTDLGLSAADAFFEAMSGITTTGSTVIVGLDHAPPGILLWRALLQWLGGIGIIVMAVGVLPVLQVGGMQLFRAEGFEQSEKVLPRVGQIAVGISIVYLGISFLCILSYWAAGMSGFDAFTHAMTTVSTGGFSTHDNSMAEFDTPTIEWLATLFMIGGSLPFVLYVQALHGNFEALFRDSQVRWFLGVIAFVTLSVTLWLWSSGGMAAEESIRTAAFNVVSIITGTGYATTDYSLWGGFGTTVFLVLMFVGGCAGSTTCSIKIFRYQVVYETMRVQIARLIQPHGVFIAHFNRKPIPEKAVESVLSFFYLFGLVFVLLAITLGALGLDFMTAVSGAATTIANVGPGLGEVIGPSGSFAPLPDTAKWLMSGAMLLGRLELFTVLVLFAPAFWRD